MKIYVQFLFFSEHRKLKKENLWSIFIFFFFWTHNGNETKDRIGSRAIAVISFDLVRSSVSVAIQEDYIIFFSGEGERRVERRVKKMPVTGERLAQIFGVSHTADYCN